MRPNEVRFEPLREDRGWYFVEYYPPHVGYRFSSVQVVTVENKDRATVAEAMENEARTWLRRYPVPVMVSAFSADGDVLSINAVRSSNHLMAWDQYPAVEPTLQWRLVPNEELPDIALDRDFIERLFASVPHRTSDEIEEEAEKYVSSMRVGWWVVFVWAVVVPLGVAILVWWSDLLGLVVVLYAFFKAGRLALRLTGRLPKSDAERKKDAEDVQMRHHHYHCKLNPQAFEKLKAENFRKSEIERTLAQADSLKAKSPAQNVDG